MAEHERDAAASRPGRAAAAEAGAPGRNARARMRAPRRRIAALNAVVAAAWTAACGPAAPEAADLVLRGGTVLPLDAPGARASAVAIRGDRIVAVGDEGAVEPWIGTATRVVELDGRLVTPGINDAHLHFAAGGLSLLEVRLGDVRSLAGIEERVRAAAAAAAPGEWITGRGWDHTRLPAEELGPGGWPTRAVLDRAAPEHPVYLRRVDGHTGWANSRALELAGIGVDTPDPPGGEIVRDPATGLPTGILKENATELVAERVPEPNVERRRRGIEAALELAARTGVTSIQTSASAEDVRIYQALEREGALTVRVYAWRSLDREQVELYREAGIGQAFGDTWLRLGVVKAYADGTLGSRTAWMLEPFADDPSTRGIAVTPPDTLAAWIAAADSAGLQVIVHAIGDAANRTVLDIYQRVQATGPERPRRHRIEHAQVLDAADVQRFAALGVIASMQPTHATSDMRWAEERIGEERAAEGAYAWRSLLDAGADIAFGTDFAVEPLAPVEGLYSAVTRQSREPPGEPAGGWLPGQRLSLEEALRAYTVGSARAEFQEEAKGTLTPGMLADVVVWDRDLLAVPPAEILEARPDRTIVGGRTVFERRENGAD